MAKARKFLASMPHLALAGACATVGALAVTVFRPDAILDRSVAAALAQVDQARQRSAPARRQQALADSPYFQLSRLDDELSLGLSKAVRVGDRIEITGSNGRQTLQVIDIREIGASLTQIETTPGPRLLLVTSREVGTGNPRLVRFIIETEEAPTVGIGGSQRTL